MKHYKTRFTKNGKEVYTNGRWVNIADVPDEINNTQQDLIKLRELLPNNLKEDFDLEFLDIEYQED